MTQRAASSAWAVLLTHPQLEPAGPTSVGIPPTAVHNAITAHSEKVQMFGDTRNRRHLTSCHAAFSRDVEPGGPGLTLMPPAALHQVVGAEIEQIKVTGITGNCRDRGAGAAGRGDATLYLDQPAQPLL
jgi:hypothetical protein